MTKSVAELQEELRVAQAAERENARKAEDARKARDALAAQRAALLKEIDQREQQIKNTLAWVEERSADVAALKKRVEEEFKDLQEPATP